MWSIIECILKVEVRNNAVCLRAFVATTTGIFNCIPQLIISENTLLRYATRAWHVSRNNRDNPEQYICMGLLDSKFASTSILREVEINNYAFWMIFILDFDDLPVGDFFIPSYGDHEFECDNRD
jgi:hypothetical protein